MHRTLLTGGTIVSMNPERHVGRGDLLIEDDRIVAIGEVPVGRRKIDETIDCQGSIVIPGLIQPHIHLCQTLFRGRADGLELLDWLRERIWPFEAAHDADSLYISALLGGAELLRTGTTAILDMGTVHHTGAVFKAAAKLGLRATIGKAMMDRGEGVPPGLLESTERSMDESLALVAEWHGQANGRLRYGFAPRFALSCSEELLRRTAKEARARGLLIHTHASENRTEADVVKRVTGFDNVAYLHHVGMSGADTVVAHCVWLTSEEQAILRSTGTHVAHCPSSNLKLASGVAQIPELLAMGINVGLAADGAACNNDLDAFVEMRLAALIQKLRGGPKAMPAETVLEMATLGGARALGLEDQIGSLEEGKKADLVVVATDGFHLSPCPDPVSALVYAAHGSDVEHVFVDGVQRVRSGRVLAVQRASLVAQAERAAVELVARAGHGTPLR
jgi:cytosine/adenosine deaminase-related metal-dependent hydrolase